MTTKPAPTSPSKRDIKLTDEFRTFALWLAVPKRQRQPQSQGELAEKLGVHPDSLSDWKKREELWAIVAEHRDIWIRENVADVVDGLIKRAKDGAAPEVKLFLQLAGVYTETTRSEITGRDGKPIQVETLVGIVREAANLSDDPESPPAGTVRDEDQGGAHH